VPGVTGTLACSPTSCNKRCSEFYRLNVVVKSLTPLLRIREFPGSNFGPETGYPDWRFSWFSSVPSGKCCDSTLKLGHDSFLPRPFKYTIYVGPYHPFIRLYINLITEKASLNKQQTEFSVASLLKPSVHWKVGFWLYTQISCRCLDIVMKYGYYSHTSAVQHLLCA
jgi:hypothetical protein